MARSRLLTVYPTLSGVACAICLLVASCQSGGPPGGDGLDGDDANGDSTEQAIMIAADLDAWLESILAHATPIPLNTYSTGENPVLLPAQWR